MYRGHLDFFCFAHAIRQYLALIAIICSVAFIGTFLVTALMPSRYTSSVSFLPQLREVKQDMFLQLVGLDEDEQPTRTDFETLYHKIIKSDFVLDRVLAERWKSTDSDVRRTVFEILDIDVSEAAGHRKSLATHDAKEWLRNKVIVFTRDQKTGYMTLYVTVPDDPVFAAELASFLVRALKDCLREYYVEKAAEQRRSLRGRLDELERELYRAETARTEFIETNQSFRTEPVLSQRYSELDREVSALASIWSEVHQQVEVSRSEEHRKSVPVVVLDGAMIPSHSSAPRRVFTPLCGTLFGFILSLVIVLWKIHPSWIVRDDSMALTRE